jgi:hypothetical protein
MLRKALVLGLTMALFGTTGWAADGPSVSADGVVTIHPGEKIVVAFKSADDLAHPALASDASGPATMSFDFQQLPGAGLMLMIENHLPVTVKYDATMVVKTPDGERELHTSICPVIPRGMGTEGWHDPIVALKLSGFHKLDGNSFACD